jgi:hypothetical protein
MELTYTQNGDYFIPDIAIKKQRPIGHYGRLHKAFLAEYRPSLYNELVLSEKLYDHCAEIDEAARNRLNIIIPQLMEQYGVNEELKAENQMLWVGKMNMCRSQAEEIVKMELVYC